jgi:hypothetical protein
MKLSAHMQRKLHKKCRICGEIKPLTEFYRNKNAADDKRGECKPCEHAYQRNGEYNGKTES